MCHAPQEAGPGGEGGNGGVGGVLSSFWSLQVPSQLAHSQLCVCVCVLRGFSCIRLFVTPWTAAHQAPLSMGFSRQEYWRGLPCPPPGDLPNPGIELEFLASSALQVDSLPVSHQGSLHTLSCISSNPTLVYSLQKKKKEKLKASHSGQVGVRYYI